MQLGCSKDEIGAKHPDWSKVTASKNGLIWESRAVAFLDKNKEERFLSIPAHVNNEYGFLREALFFGGVNCLTGKQIVFNSKAESLYASYTTLMADGDVVEDRFVICEDRNNFIDIQTLDIVNMKLVGNFRLTFVRDVNDPITNPNLPDTIRFDDGEFCLKIIDSNKY